MRGHDDCLDQWPIVPPSIGLAVLAVQPVSAVFAAPLFVAAVELPPDIVLPPDMLLPPAMVLLLFIVVPLALPVQPSGFVVDCGAGPLMLPPDMLFWASAGPASRIAAAAAARVVRIIVSSGRLTGARKADVAENTCERAISLRRGAAPPIRSAQIAEIRLGVFQSLVDSATLQG